MLYIGFLRGGTTQPSLVHEFASFLQKLVHVDVQVCAASAWLTITRALQAHLHIEPAPGFKQGTVFATFGLHSRICWYFRHPPSAPC
mmetsp:Transcript_26536/g.72869  ORF Transcript_26536/g.72869 Transcript_26536/m.72869 type:complete len:87 (+) Transcript_26536:176-436(+)